MVSVENGSQTTKIIKQWK